MEGLFLGVNADILRVRCRILGNIAAIFTRREIVEQNLKKCL